MNDIQEETSKVQLYKTYLVIHSFTTSFTTGVYESRLIIALTLCRPPVCSQQSNLCQSKNRFY